MPAVSETLSNDPLARFADGVRVTGGTPVPLLATTIDVRVVGGLGIVRTGRMFRNAEDRSIEATLTFPVPVHATLTSLTAAIGDRVLTGKVQRKQQARATYEAAIDAGKTAVLHEEALRGIHILSIGHIPPGEEVTVTSTWAMPLAFSGGVARLRVPLTVGDVYGRSPLSDSDALTHAPVRQEAMLTVSSDSGRAEVNGVTLAEGGARVPLDRPLDIAVTNWLPRTLRGRAADGRAVSLAIVPMREEDGPLDVSLLLDQSGSMNEAATIDDFASPGKRVSKHDAMVAGVRQALATARRGDRVRLWRFANDCAPVACVEDLPGPGGGTEIGRALARVASCGERGGGETADIVLLTDGKSHDIDVQALSRSGRRFSVILIGEDSLDAHVGHLAALTGGQLFVAPDSGAAPAILSALGAMRLPHRIQPPLEGAPVMTHARMGGMEVQARWSGVPAGDTPPGDAPGEDRAGDMPGNASGNTSGNADTAEARIVGAVAAALVLPRMAEDAAAAFAEAHGIVCHLTSLVLVDDAGAAQEGLPMQRKVPLMTPASASGVIAASVMPGPARSVRYRAAAPYPPAEGFRAAVMPRATAMPAAAPVPPPHADALVPPPSGGGEPFAAPPAPPGPEGDTPGRVGPEQSGAGRVPLRQRIGGLFGRRAVPPAIPAHAAPPVPAFLSPVSLAGWAGRIDWSRAEALRQGDAAALPAALVPLATRASRLDPIAALASLLGVPPLAVVIALLARTMAEGDRDAGRVFRAVLGRAEAARVEAAAWAVGL